MGKGKGVVAAFQLESENQGFVVVGYVLYSLHVCVCVWAHQIRQLRLTIPCSSALFMSCAPGAFLGGS
jgi:hypothetical protein